MVLVHSMPQRPTSPGDVTAIREQPRDVVPYVTAVTGEGAVSVVAAGIALGVLLVSPARVTGGSLSAWTQGLIVVALVAFWSFGLYAGGTRMRQAAQSAQSIPGPWADIESARTVKRNLRRGCLRNALFAVVVIAACGLGFQSVWLGLTVPLMQASTMISALGVSRWQRRRGTVLWKPALSSVGREAHRASPFYVTTSQD